MEHEISQISCCELLGTVWLLNSAVYPSSFVQRQFGAVANLVVTDFPVNSIAILRILRNKLGYMQRYVMLAAT
jgi:hypothetical protein